MSLITLRVRTLRSGLCTNPAFIKSLQRLLSWSAHILNHWWPVPECWGLLTVVIEILSQLSELLWSLSIELTTGLCPLSLSCVLWLVAASQASPAELLCSVGPGAWSSQHEHELWEICLESVSQCQSRDAQHSDTDICIEWWWLGIETWHETLMDWRVQRAWHLDRLTLVEKHIYQDYCLTAVLTHIIWVTVRDCDGDNVMWLYCESIECVPCVHLYCFIVTSLIFRLCPGHNVGSWHAWLVLTSLIVRSN